MDYLIPIPFLPQTIFIGSLLIFLTLFFFRQQSSQLKISDATKTLPEVRGAWPLIGHLHLILGGPKPPHVIFSELADKYGPAFMFRLGKYKTLVVSDKYLVKELFTTKDTVALTRPKFIQGEHLGYDGAMFGFSEYGPYWREIRKIVSVELLSVHRLQLLNHVRLSETETSIKEMYKLYKDQNKNNEAKKFVLVEMNKWFGNLTLNIILRMVAGKRYYGLVDPKDEKESRRCQEALREVFRLTGLYVPSDLIPILRWFDLGGYEKKMKAVNKEMDEIADSWVKEHREKRKTNGNTTDKHRQDFVDVMISLFENAENAASYDADTIIKSTCINLIAGGSDTTSVTLIWGLSLIMNNPPVLKKIQEELDLQVGRDRFVQESDIPKLPYLQAVVKETLRLYPAAALGGIREFTEDCTIGGYSIRKGMRLIPNLWKLHRDPKVFDEPLKFKPERFLTTHKDWDVKGQQFELIPFSSGRRICPGVTFGLQMLHLGMASACHAFNFEIPAGETIDMTETAGLINHKATPLPLLVEPRLSHTLYQ